MCPVSKGLGTAPQPRIYYGIYFKGINFCGQKVSRIKKREMFWDKVSRKKQQRIFCWKNFRILVQINDKFRQKTFLFQLETRSSFFRKFWLLIIKLKCQQPLLRNVQGGKYGEETLPPNQDSLLQYIKRVNYECFIRRRCCEAHVGAPSPVGNGWIEEDGCLCIEWITIPFSKM